jgi:hypothetical protein
LEAARRFAKSGGLVFVDESAEEIPSLHAIGPVPQRRAPAVGREEAQRTVRPVFVVVLGVDADDVFEMAPSEDEDPVETFDSERAEPAFGVSTLKGVKTTFY